jgi:hypothetical protein
MPRQNAESYSDLSTRLMARFFRAAEFADWFEIFLFYFKAFPWHGVCVPATRKSRYRRPRLGVR